MRPTGRDGVVDREPLRSPDGAAGARSERCRGHADHPRLRELRRHRLGAGVLRPGDEPRGGARTPRRGLGARDPRRSTPQTRTAADGARRSSASGSRRGAATSATEVVIATKTFNPMADGADRGLARARISRQVETSLAPSRRRARSALPRARLRPRRPAGGDTPRVRRARSGREGRRRGRLELQRGAARRGARALRARGPDAVRVGAELLLAARAGRPRDGLPALPRARARLHAVQPARRRLADGEVPSRRGAAARVAHDPPAGRVGALPGSRRPSTRSKPSSARPPTAASRWRRSRSPGCSTFPR